MRRRSEMSDLFPRSSLYYPLKSEIHLDIRTQIPPHRKRSICILKTYCKDLSFNCGYFENTHFSFVTRMFILDQIEGTENLHRSRQIIFWSPPPPPPTLVSA